LWHVVSRDGGAFSFGVFNFEQFRVLSGRKVRGKDGGAGAMESCPVDDALRYRTNAAECLSAAERCDPAHRSLTLAIAASWLSLARQQIAMDELLAIWNEASADTVPDEGRWRFQYPRARADEPEKKPPAPPLAGGPRVAKASAFQHELQSA
jgi:hypothetical protein